MLTPSPEVTTCNWPLRATIANVESYEFRYPILYLYRRQAIDSADVNAYLREITGEDFTAKDFRTWAGTVLAAQALAEAATFKSQVPEILGAAARALPAHLIA